MAKQHHLARFWVWLSSPWQCRRVSQQLRIGESVGDNESNTVVGDDRPDGEADNDESGRESGEQYGLAGNKRSGLPMAVPHSEQIFTSSGVSQWFRYILNLCSA